MLKAPVNTLTNNNPNNIPETVFLNNSILSPNSKYNSPRNKSYGKSSTSILKSSSPEASQTNHNFWNYEYHFATAKKHSWESWKTYNSGI
jgi:hypothetical protein